MKTFYDTYYILGRTIQFFALQIWLGLHRRCLTVTIIQRRYVCLIKGWNDYCFCVCASHCVIQNIGNFKSLRLIKREEHQVLGVFYLYFLNYRSVQFQIDVIGFRWISVFSFFLNFISFGKLWVQISINKNFKYCY